MLAKAAIPRKFIPTKYIPAIRYVTTTPCQIMPQGYATEQYNKGVYDFYYTLVTLTT